MSDLIKFHGLKLYNLHGFMNIDDRLNNVWRNHKLNSIFYYKYFDREMNDTYPAIDGFTSYYINNIFIIKPFKPVR